MYSLLAVFIININIRIITFSFTNLSPAEFGNFDDFNFENGHFE